MRCRTAETNFRAVRFRRAARRSGVERRARHPRSGALPPEMGESAISTPQDG